MKMFSRVERHYIIIYYIEIDTYEVKHLPSSTMYNVWRVNPRLGYGYLQQGRMVAVRSVWDGKKVGNPLIKVYIYPYHKLLSTI